MGIALADLDWRDLQNFLAVAEAGNAAEAAEHLGVDVTTVRRRVAILQGSLGLRLFIKVGRSLQLTPEGNRIRLIVSRMAELGKDISRDATDAMRDLVGAVRISTMEGFGSFFLAPRLPEFVSRHPHL
jgi:DNA-binding transcriptional LysR family regulator